VPLLLAGWGMPARAQTAPLSAFDSAKVRALLRTRLPCLGCHAIGGAGGRIGPDLTAVSARRTPAYVAAMVDRPQAVVPGTTMPRVPMPPAMRTLLVRYLTNGVPPTGGGGAAPGPTSRPADRAPVETSTGAALYSRYCAACHGERGGGDGPNARYLPARPAAHADAALMSTKTDDRLFDAISVGGYPLGRSSLMPAFGETLSRQQIHLLVRHLRALCRCAGPSWSRAHDADAP
jgi:mono/diheme cytochrome c family protein